MVCQLLPVEQFSEAENNEHGLTWIIVILTCKVSTMFAQTITAPSVIGDNKVFHWTRGRDIYYRLTTAAFIFFLLCINTGRLTLIYMLTNLNTIYHDTIKCSQVTQVLILSRVKDFYLCGSCLD